MEDKGLYPLVTIKIKDGGNILIELYPDEAKETVNFFSSRRFL